MIVADILEVPKIIATCSGPLREQRGPGKKLSRAQSVQK